MLKVMIKLTVILHARLCVINEILGVVTLKDMEALFVLIILGLSQALDQPPSQHPDPLNQVFAHNHY